MVDQERNVSINMLVDSGDRSESRDTMPNDTDGLIKIKDNLSKIDIPDRSQSAM